MRFNHMVKHDGKFYPVGTEIPISLEAQVVELLDENENAVGEANPEEVENSTAQAAELLSGKISNPDKKITRK